VWLWQSPMSKRSKAKRISQRGSLKSDPAVTYYGESGVSINWRFMKVLHFRRHMEFFQEDTKPLWQIINFVLGTEYQLDDVDSRHDDDTSSYNSFLECVVPPPPSKSSPTHPHHLIPR
jgi:hypothetical protein